MAIRRHSADGYYAGYSALRSPPACVAVLSSRWCCSSPISTPAQFYCCPISPNIAGTSRSLLDGTADHSDPLTGPRLTLVGQAEVADDPRRLARFTTHHPASSAYSGFADFRLYRVRVERGHLVAGFGRIHWIEGRDLLFDVDARELAAAEPAILKHMNEDHAEAIANYARHLLGRTGTGWQMTGIDPEGIDLRCGGETARLDFAAPVLTPQAARAALVELAEKAQEERIR